MVSKLQNVIVKLIMVFDKFDVQVYENLVTKYVLIFPVFPHPIKRLTQGPQNLKFFLFLFPPSKREALSCVCLPLHNIFLFPGHLCARFSRVSESCHA